MVGGTGPCPRRSPLDQLGCHVGSEPSPVPGASPVSLRGAVAMLLGLCALLRSVGHTMKPTVRCNRNLQFPFRCQVCQVPQMSYV